MSARNAKRLFMVLAAMLFALHAQAMDHVRAPTHGHAAEHSSPTHDEGGCDFGCCAASACCVQAVEAEGVEAQEHHSPVFRIVSHKVVASTAVSPPDPPPRSQVV